MARWDAILSLPVQNPLTLEFSSDDLVWSKVEGWHDKLDRVALIPFLRVDDFVRGESANKDCPTRFHVEARRRRPPSMSYKPKVDGILEYILYVTLLFYLSLCLEMLLVIFFRVSINLSCYWCAGIGVPLVLMTTGRVALYGLVGVLMSRRRKMRVDQTLRGAAHVTLL